MPALFANRYAPITHNMGFINCGLGQVFQMYLEWMRGIGIEYEASPFSCGFEQSLAQLSPLTTPRRKLLLHRTDSKWTAYLDNGITGPDPVPPVSQLCEQLQCSGVAISYVPHTIRGNFTNARGTYGAVQFQLFDGNSDVFLKIIRTISVAYDRGWRFDLSGAAQPFEDNTSYTAKRIVDRFTPEMLSNYCAAIGIRPFDESFYVGEGVLLSRQTEFQNPVRELSLADARHEIGL